MSPFYPEMANPYFGAAEAREPKSKGAPVWEQLLVTIWIFVTMRTFPGDELILYPLALFFVVRMVICADEFLPVAARSAILFALPVLCAVSWGWSAAPEAALRFGIMLIFNALIVIYIATRMNAGQLARAIFLAGAALVLQSLTAYENFHRGGLFTSKNYFANRMLFVFVAALAVAYNREENAVLRLLALPFIATTFYFMVLANSATALLISVGSFVVMTGLWLLWNPLSRIQHARSFAFLALLAAVIAGLMVLLNADTQSLYGQALQGLGKDGTLTGRTMLWEAAERIWQEKFWLGTGAEGFWLWSRGEAATLLELSHKRAGTDFNFHNSYIEVRVHLGMFGLIAIVASVAWTLWHTISGWLREQTMARSFLLLMALSIFLTSFTESTLFGVFDISTLVFYGAAVTTIAERQRLHRASQARPGYGYYDEPLAPQAASPGPAG